MAPGGSPRSRPVSCLPVAVVSQDTCSAKGCQAAAVWALRWNNPKLHTPERRKVWLACETHRQSLADFLAARTFLRDVVPHTQVGG